MGNSLSATTTFAPQVISISTNATMQVSVLLAIVAAATAAPTFVVNPNFEGTARIDGAPIAHIGAATTYSHAIPSTFYSSSFAHGAIPTTYSASSFAHGAIPTTYVSGSAAVPTTYLAGSSFPLIHNTPLTYSAVNPIVYSSSHVVAPAVVPKSVAQTKGTSHIVY